MTISYQGDNYFKIQSGDNIILVDPTNARSFKGATTIILTALQQASSIQLENGSASSPLSGLVVEHQGEYETKGIHIEGWSSGNDGKTEYTMYKIKWDDITIGIFGHLIKEPDQKALLALNGCDIVIAPAGGSPYISAAASAKLVRQIEPSIVIPALFKDPKPFIKEFGGDGSKPEEKLTIKKKDMSPNAMKVVLLSS